MLQKAFANNPAIVQLLGLCPLLGVSNTVKNALILGLITMFILLASSLSISIIRGIIAHKLRIVVFCCTIATWVSCAEFILLAYDYATYEALGVFLPLVVTNCIILARLELCASKQSMIKSGLDAITMGLGFFVVLLLLGVVREILGNATLFTGSAWQINLPYTPMLMFALPIGAFWCLGLLIATKQWLENKKNHQQQMLIITKSLDT